MGELSFRPIKASSDWVQAKPNRQDPVDAQQQLSQATPVPHAADVDRTEIDRSVAENWDDLIERVRSSGAWLRGEKARLHEREKKLHELVLRVEQDLRDANERVLRAEARARDVEVECKREIVEWQKRTLAAEEKARTMEHWKNKARDAILNEFR